MTRRDGKGKTNMWEVLERERRKEGRKRREGRRVGGRKG